MVKDDCAHTHKMPSIQALSYSIPILILILMSPDACTQYFSKRLLSVSLFANVNVKYFTNVSVAKNLLRYYKQWL